MALATPHRSPVPVAPAAPGRLGWVAFVPPSLIIVAAIVQIIFDTSMWPWALAAALAASAGIVAIAALRAHDRRYRHLFSRVPVGLYRTSPDGRIAAANPVLAQILGFGSPNEMLALPAASLYVDPADRDNWTAQVNRALGPVAAELRMRRRDGEAIWVRDQVIPVRDRRGRVRYYEGELEDITGQRRHWEELEQALRSRIELIGTVSHELRTPLTAIVGYARLLADGHGLTPEERAEMAGVVEQQADDMVDIVEDLLTAAQAEAGTLRVAAGPIDLAEEARRAVTGMESRHTGTLEVAAEPAPALGDAHRVRQVIRNLVANAIAHGGDRITVATSTEGHRARLVVTDDGPGLSPGDEERVFEAFQRGSRARGGHGSVGLGLTISRQLARLMGGDLTFAREGGLTVFRLTTALTKHRRRGRLRGRRRHAQTEEEVVGHEPRSAGIHRAGLHRADGPARRRAVGHPPPAGRPDQGQQGRLDRGLLRQLRRADRLLPLRPQAGGNHLAASPVRRAPAVGPPRQSAKDSARSPAHPPVVCMRQGPTAGSPMGRTPRAASQHSIR
jgi:PAS domain S-box-containing protein